ncbi:MAG TPA: type II secretion system F family protein [Bryobacteraceae bacterium]|nr:type II secretion system F family protein [Bryobacteraceae bacterium]
MLIVSIFAFFIVTFTLASIVVAISWMAFLKTRTEESEAEQGELEAGGKESSVIRTERLSTINFWDNLLARFDFMDILKTRIEQADLDWSVGRLTIAMALVGAVAFVILFRFMGFWPAFTGALLSASVPYSYVLRLRDKRFCKFSENFPDVLDSLSRALRAGYPLSASMDMVAAETAPPVSTEMRKTAAEANLGVGWNRALENLGHRVPLLEVNLFVSAVQLHSRTGGRLSDVMSQLAENMRESTALRGEVRSLAAHGKLTGVILTILPILIAAMMLYVSPEYMQVLWDHPYGKSLITAAVVCLALAHFVIRKIVDIKV